MGFISIMNRANCQCIHTSTTEMPTKLNAATMALLIVSPTKVSMALISVTKCELTVPLPKVSYSDMDMDCKRSNNARRMR